MPNFRLRHPADPTARAIYGHDPERGGPYLDVVCGGRKLTWDAADLGEDPIVGALVVLAEFSFLGGSEVDEAVVWLDRPSCWPGRPPRRVQRVLRIVRKLERAGA